MLGDHRRASRPTRPNLRAPPATRWAVNPGAPAPVPGAAVGPSSGRRLTKSEYINTVGDLLGVTLTADDASLLPQDQPATGGGFRNDIQGLLPTAVRTDAYETLAALVAERTAWAGSLSAHASCTDSTAACREGFIRHLGRVLYRRPLTDFDVHNLAPLFDLAANDAAGFQAGARLVVEAMLQSPHFLYRLERLDNVASSTGKTAPSSFEIATRLSYLAWLSAPTPELLDAAERGELSTDESYASGGRARGCRRGGSSWVRRVRRGLAAALPTRYPNAQRTARRVPGAPYRNEGGNAAIRLSHRPDRASRSFHALHRQEDRARTIPRASLRGDRAGPRFRELRPFERSPPRGHPHPARFHDPARSARSRHHRAPGVDGAANFSVLGGARAAGQRGHEDRFDTNQPHRSRTLRFACRIAHLQSVSLHVRSARPSFRALRSGWQVQKPRRVWQCLAQRWRGEPRRQGADLRRHGFVREHSQQERKRPALLREQGVSVRSGSFARKTPTKARSATIAKRFDDAGRTYVAAITSVATSPAFRAMAPTQ